MRFEGVLTAWNHEAGYGSIRAKGGGAEVFVSLTAFPTDGEGPRIDEPLSFEVVTKRDGRKEAVRLQRLPTLHPALREAASAARLRERQSQRKRRLAVWGLGAVLTIVVVAGGVRWWQQANKMPAAQQYGLKR